MESHRFCRKCAICGMTCFLQVFLWTLNVVDCGASSGIEDLVYLPIEKLHQLKYVCDAHFARKCFTVNGKRQLKNAVQTLKLTRPLLSDDLFTEFPLHVKSYNDTKKTDKNSQVVLSRPSSIWKLKLLLKAIEIMAVNFEGASVTSTANKSCDVEDFIPMPSTSKSRSSDL